MKFVLGGMTMNVNRMREVLKYYFEGDCQIHQGASGMNNLTRFIECNGNKYVLRIYQNHQDEALVKVEQKVLSMIKGVPVPVLVPTIKGEYVVNYHDQLAVLFEYQEGVNLKLERLEQYKNYGEMVGRLSQALSKLEDEKQGYLPYYELDKAYPNHEIEAFCQMPDEAFKDLRDELKIVEACYVEWKKIKDELAKLPKQLIHGDINSSNLLMNDQGMISCILDFEFVTKDLRAMEIAICLSEILYEGKDDIWPKLEAFMEGLRNSLELTDEEIIYLPSLILLRRLDVVLHFITRYRCDISSEIAGKTEYLRKQILKLVDQWSWMNENKEAFVQLVKN